MEFSRRGPATGGAGDGHRFPDPPAHGEREPMLATRDALLSQLHMACLRHEIIEADLAKIERAMVLPAATGGQQTTPMPMPWLGVATADAGRSKAGPFSAKQPVAQQNAEFDDPKLLESNRDALLSQLYMARLRQETTEAELAKIERAMALCAATGGHQTLTMPMPMPWHGVATADAGRSNTGPFSAEQPVAQQNAEFDDRKPTDSNKAVPPSMMSPVAKLELTGITIPKSPMKWSCNVCQVQATSEQNLQQHYVGQKHLSNVATLDPTTKASGQMAKTAAEPSLGTEQKKTSSIKWSCSTCQANGTSQSTLEVHLKGRRHQQNIAATSTEGDKNGMSENVTTQEEKSHSMATADARRSKAMPFNADAEELVAQQTAEFDDRELPDSNNAIPPSKASHAEKWELTIPVKKNKSSIKWSCSICQANGTSQSTLETHLKGKRHQQNIVAATSVERGKNGIPKKIVAQEAEPRSINVLKLSEKPPPAWSCSICQVICTCQTDLKNHLKGIRHRERVQSLLEQSKNKTSDSEPRKSKLIPDSRWICGICHALCTCESDTENHLAGHQLNKIKQESNNPTQLAKNKEPTSELNSVMCEAKCNSKSQFEAHCSSSRHQQKIQAILSKGNIAKGTSSRTKSELPSDGSNSKDASSEKAVKQPTLYFCEVCNFLCESSTMLVHHRYGKKHRARLSARNELY